MAARGRAGKIGLMNVIENRVTTPKNPNEYVREMVKEHPFFAGFKPEHLHIVATGAREQLLNEGEVLFREGEPATHLYIVESGKLAVDAHYPAKGAVTVETIGPGEVLGWSWLFPPFVWHFRARALEPSRIIALDGAHMLAKAEIDRNFGYDLMKRVAQILIHRLQATRTRMLESEIQNALTD